MNYLWGGLACLGAGLAFVIIAVIFDALIDP